MNLNPLIQIHDICSEWIKKNKNESPETIADEYPKLMIQVLNIVFGLNENAAKLFIKSACFGNWDRLHPTGIEKQVSAEIIATALTNDILYCSDRWSWDRVLRIQWLYQILKIKNEEEKEAIYQGLVIKNEQQ